VTGAVVGEVTFIVVPALSAPQAGLTSAAAGRTKSSARVSR